MQVANIAPWTAASGNIELAMSYLSSTGVLVVVPLRIKEDLLKNFHRSSLSIKLRVLRVPDPLSATPWETL